MVFFWQLQLEAEKARTEKERAKIDLDAARLQGKEDKLLGERKLTAIEQDKGQELLALKAELSDRSQDAKAQLQKAQEDIAVLRGKERQAARRAVELEDELQKKAELESEMQQVGSGRGVSFKVLVRQFHWRGPRWRAESSAADSMRFWSRGEGIVVLVMLAGCCGGGV